MAYVAGYDYDIFISYSRDDNAPIGNPRGWVERFHEYLENWLVKRLSLEGLIIWRDCQLLGNTNFDEAILNRIRRSALFFVLNSRNYVQSEYCRKELEWFHQVNSDRPSGLKIGEEHRIFNLLLNNLPNQDWPHQLQGAVGFSLHDASGNDLGEFTEPSDDNFRKQLRKVVEAVQKTLEQFPKAQRVAAPVSGIEPTVKVFVADVSDPLVTRRDRLLSDLKGRQVQVWDDVPPPTEEVPHATKMREVLQRTDLTVHLFDEWPGHPIVDRGDSTYSRVQMELALPSVVPTIVWVPVDLDFKTIEDESHREFLDSLENGPRGKNNYEFVREAQIDLTAFILQKIDAFPRPSRVDGPTPLLVDSHQKDQIFLYEVAALLAKKGANVETTKEFSDPIQSLENFDRAIRRVKHLIVMYGQVTPAWLTNRLKKAIKIAADQFAAGEAPLEGIWVYRLPGSTVSLNLPKMPFRVEVLDNSPYPSLEPKVLTPLLSSLD